ncbi:portal protein [uncultured Mediterranean phage uvMED]|nr:portal protein [uncultured Mediterranean phage uvMED]
MAKKIDRLEDLELKNTLQSHIHNSLGFLGGTLSAEREKSLEYYQGDKLGNEIDGRSQVVSTDVADTIESLLPNLLRVFTSSDKVVVCEPVKAEDSPLADQATAYLNHIFYKENDGFQLLYNFFKDALLEKNGILKIYYDKTQKVEYETYENLTLAEKNVLNDTQDEIEIVEEKIIIDEKAKETFENQIKALEQQGINIEEVQTPNFNLYNCKIKRIISKGNIKVESVPPEEFLIDRTAIKLEDANFVAHRVQMTRSELISMGYDKEDVDSLPTSDASTLNTERLARYQNIEDFPFNTSDNKSTQTITVYENYVRYDADGDGIAELRKILSVGDTSEFVLENMPCDSIPFVSVTPIPMPHRFYGRSVAELVEDIQLMKSTVMRQLLDNMYLTNNNRVAVMDGMVNMDDLLTSRPGGVVRTKQQPNQVMQPIQAQPISQQAFPLLEYLDTVREVRTGVTKYNQGLDSDSLNKTATGISAIMNQTQMRAELIARIFAETGVKDLFRKMFELSVKYQDKEKIIQLNNQYIPVMPTEWKNRFNVTIQVGLGTGTKEQQIVILNNILDKQLQAFNLQGQREFPMVSLKNIYNTLSKIVENAGLKTVDSYFVNPDLGRQFVTPPPPPPVTPIEKIEFTRIDAENKRKIADLELQYKELEQKQQESLLDFETRIKDMALKYNTQLDTAKIKADADLDRTLMSGNNKILEQAQKSGNILSRQIRNLNEPQRQSQESRRTEQGNSGETDITE